MLFIYFKTSFINEPSDIRFYRTKKKKKGGKKKKKIKKGKKKKKKKKKNLGSNFECSQEGKDLKVPL